VLRTVEQYVESLRDGRRVYYRGRLVPDVTEHAALRTAVDHASIDYRMAEEPGEHRALAVTCDEQTGQEISRYFALPRSSEDLMARSRLIDAATRQGGTLVVLIKEIGSDALFALHMVAHQLAQGVPGKAGLTPEPRYLENVRRFYAHCRDHDLAMAVAQTDVKGDRSLGPSEQEHPDYYLRVVERRPDGIVVRGAKVHTSVSANANELIVLPTRALREEDRDYAVAFAVPLDTPGLTLVVSPYGDGEKQAFEHPISARHKMPETLTIFDDVFVPAERVFLDGEWQAAGPLAHTFVQFHRFTAVSYKLSLVDALVGAAALLADLNGLDKVTHIREKLTWLIAYAETLRALTAQAAAQCDCSNPLGLAVPNTLLTNVAKLHFAGQYHQAVARVQEIAGGLLVTAPGAEDWDDAELGPKLRRYLGGRRGVAAEERMRAMHLVQDLTSSEYGGYQEVLAIHAEGSIEAEKLAIFRGYDLAAAKEYARLLAGIGGERA